MLLLRFLLGVVSLALAGLLLNSAMQRLMRGLAMIFAGSLALAIGGLLLGGGAWTAIRRRRARRAERAAGEESAV